MSLSTPSCAVKLGYTPTVFLVGHRQNIVVYSRCAGIAEWTVADTDDWTSDASKAPNSEGYYAYRLRPKWHQAVTHDAGIRCHFRPLPLEEHEPITLTLDVIVEDSRYPQLPRISTISPKLLAPGMLTLVLWVATAVFGLWAIADIITDIWPAILIALTGQMDTSEQNKLYNLSANCWLLLLSLVWIGIVIGGGEYHHRRIGQLNSWKLFGITLAAEGAILIAALFT